MYRLKTSLILAVIASVIGTGWLADRLFSQWVGTDIEPAQQLEVRARTLVTLMESRLLGAEARQRMVEDGVNLHRNLATDENGFSDSTDRNDELAKVINIDDISLPETLRQQVLAGSELLLESESQLQWYQRIGQSDEVLSVSIYSSPRHGQSLRLVFTLLFYAGVAALVLAWLYPLIRQLQRLGVAAETLGKGDLQQRIPTHASSQLHDLESQFNRMAQRLQQLVEDNKLLCGAVSHDMRTPLARLRFGIDALQEKLSDENTVSASQQPDAMRYLQRISTDLTLMEGLVTALLDFARLDQNLHEMPMMPIRLSDVVREQLTLLTDSEVSVSAQMDAERDLIMGDTRYARMLLSNLVDNALGFANEKVLVRLYEHEERLVLSIEDDGPGFPSGDLEKLLKPFERGWEPSEGDDDVLLASSGKGYGLGLAIVDRLSQWFNASLLLGTSQTLGGGQVMVSFTIAIKR